MRIIKQCDANDAKPKKRAREIKIQQGGVQAVGRGCQVASRKKIKGKKTKWALLDWLARPSGFGWRLGRSL